MDEPRGPRVIDLNQLRPPKIPVQGVVTVIVVALAAVAIWSSVFKVEAEEVGVVLTFGEFSRQTDPGLNFKWPFPIQTVTKVPIQRQLKQEFGFRTQRVGQRSQYATVQDESLMLTGDLNVAVVEWITQFRISDPYNFLFQVRALDETFRDMNEAVMREVIGDRSVNEVLTIGRQEIASEVEQRLQDLCDQYETGLHIEQIVLQDVNPPDPVKPAFNEVNEAQQERERMINEAETEYNRVIPRARGEALQTIQQAEGYATDRVNRAKGDAEAFKALLAAYKRSPEVTRRRIYLETMGLIYPKVKNKVVLDANLKGVLPLLPLSGKEVKP
jgi:membrane protease subunit HflK